MSSKLIPSPKSVSKLKKDEALTFILENINPKLMEGDTYIGICIPIAIKEGVEGLLAQSGWEIEGFKVNGEKIGESEFFIERLHPRNFCRNIWKNFFTFIDTHTDEAGLFVMSLVMLVFFTFIFYIASHAK